MTRPSLFTLYIGLKDFESGLVGLDSKSGVRGATIFHASQNQCWGPCDCLIFSTIILPIVVRKGATDAPYTIADRTNRWTDVPRTYTNSVHETRCKQSHPLHGSRCNIISSYLYGFFLCNSLVFFFFRSLLNISIITQPPTPPPCFAPWKWRCGANKGFCDFWPPGSILGGPTCIHAH